MSPLRWTCLSVRHLATTLTKQGHPVSPQKVAQMLHEAGYSLQGTHKTLEGTTHPDRDAQFRHIPGKVAEMQREAEPVISVATKDRMAPPAAATQPAVNADVERLLHEVLAVLQARVRSSSASAFGWARSMRSRGWSSTSSCCR